MDWRVKNVECSQSVSVLDLDGAVGFEKTGIIGGTFSARKQVAASSESERGHAKEHFRFS
jgi:hypothetical protein